MPTYIYQHPQTQEVLEIVQRISDPHEYIDNQGVQWNRVFTVPHTNIPSMTRVEAGSEEDFIRKTRDSGGTLGDLFDLSQELSDKRKNERGDGKDPVQQKFYKDYSKTRNGLKHRSDNSDTGSKYKPNSDGVIEV